MDRVAMNNLEQKLRAAKEHTIDLAMEKASVCWPIIDRAGLLEAFNHIVYVLGVPARNDFQLVNAPPNLGGQTALLQLRRHAMPEGVAFHGMPHSEAARTTPRSRSGNHASPAHRYPQS